LSYGEAYRSSVRRTLAAAPAPPRRRWAAVEEGGLLTILQKVSAYRRYWKVELTPKGQPGDSGDLSRVARENVLVRIGDLAACE